MRENNSKKMLSDISPLSSFSSDRSNYVQKRTLSDDFLNFNIFDSKSNKDGARLSSRSNNVKPKRVSWSDEKEDSVSPYFNNIALFSEHNSKKPSTESLLKYKNSSSKESLNAVTEL